eukprot:TRINITY_DN36145_c0_g1_i1.p1 TRINITY_DN36145_c0_g1~~TRINITY_DN36145_c0_g1_i1.p1  ORF type:complete len:610 (+),score=128.59 TRINITY_DN36145_c0_g1_i1:114-1943(+)
MAEAWARRLAVAATAAATAASSASDWIPVTNDQGGNLWYNQATAETSQTAPPSPTKGSHPFLAPTIAPEAFGASPALESVPGGPPLPKAPESFSTTASEQSEANDAVGKAFAEDASFSAGGSQTLDDVSSTSTLEDASSAFTSTSVQWEQAPAWLPQKISSKPSEAKAYGQENVSESAGEDKASLSPPQSSQVLAGQVLRTGSVCDDLDKLHSTVIQSPAAEYALSLGTWLRQSPYQVWIALGTLVSGTICAWDGPGVWHVLFISGAAIGAAGLVHFEVQAKGLAPNVFAETVLIITSAAVAALAAHSGFDGSQILLGAALGLLGAISWGDLPRSWDGAIPAMDISAFWYCLGASFGAWAFLFWQRPLLATMGPLFGCFLAVTGVSFLASKALAASGSKEVSFLPMSDESWAEGAFVLLGIQGLQACSSHACCALLAALLETCRRRALALCVLVAYVVLTALTAAAAGLRCHQHEEEESSKCSAGLAVPGRWQWQLSGCLLWATFAAFCGWRQLVAMESASVLQRYEPIISKDRGGYKFVPDASPSNQAQTVPQTQLGGLVPQTRLGGLQAAPGDPFQTRLPAGFEAADANPTSGSLSGWLETRRSRAG